MEKKGFKFKISFNAPVVLVFVGLCFIVTLLNYITKGASNLKFFATYRSSLASPLTYVRFFTHVLGHADWAHFAGNTSYILLLGPMLEEKYGSKKLIGVILITGLVAGVVNYIFFPTTALLGASGVVFAFILLSSFTSFKQGEIPITFILVALFFVGQQLVEGITLSDNVSQLGHILGGIVGSIIGYNLNKKTNS